MEPIPPTLITRSCSSTPRSSSRETLSNQYINVLNIIPDTADIFHEQELAKAARTNITYVRKAKKAILQDITKHIERLKRSQESSCSNDCNVAVYLSVYNVAKDIDNVHQINSEPSNRYNNCNTEAINDGIEYDVSIINHMREGHNEPRAMVF